MALSAEEITKFQTLYRNRFGKEIGVNEAYEQGVKLIWLVELIYKPMTEKEWNIVQERRNKTK